MAIKKINFNAGWLFINDWQDSMRYPEYDDSAWQKVELPHDWSIEGEFSEDAVSFCRGGYLPGGYGCYRKKFTIPEECREYAARLYFGGIFRNSEIFLNGHKIGGREWGYISFEVALDEFLLSGENLLAVKVDNHEALSCRWYSGSGIYRNSFLEFSGKKVILPRWGIEVKTLSAEAEESVLQISVPLKNRTSVRQKVQVKCEITAPDGTRIWNLDEPQWVASQIEGTFYRKVKVSAPLRWDLETPHLYTLKCQIFSQDELADTAEIHFGIRKLVFDAEKGLFLNDRPVKVNGVCLHNDGGALGAACGKTTFLRQLRFLKTMGCNGVRTSHHPFSEEFLDACDECGMLVLAEAFDEWQEPCSVMPMLRGEPQRMNDCYYSAIFDRCAISDLRDMVKRDRHHPSIFMWSIGNEVPQMYKYSGGHIAGMLRETVKNYDDTRPVTCAVVSWKVDHNNIALLDVGGYNYPTPAQMDEFHAAHPGQPMIITEHYSAQTRYPNGRYFAKGKLAELADVHPGKMEFINHIDNNKPGEEAAKAVLERPFVIGQFIWTGWDYMGEPTPYDFPAHSSFFGVIDICGFPKDGYWYYKSVWQDEPIIHIASHWNYLAGDTAEIDVISNCREVELFLNGKSLGRKYAPERFFWEVPYQPGELRAVGIAADESEVYDSFATAGEPLRLVLQESLMQRSAADSVVYVECQVLDGSGNRVPTAEIPVTVEVTGDGVLQALDNGNQLSCEPFQKNKTRSTCAGRCLAIIRVTGEGTIKVSVSAPGVAGDEINID